MSAWSSYQLTTYDCARRSLHGQVIDVNPGARPSSPHRHICAGPGGKELGLPPRAAWGPPETPLSTALLVRRAPANPITTDGRRRADATRLLRRAPGASDSRRPTASGPFYLGLRRWQRAALLPGPMMPARPNAEACTKISFPP